MFATLLQVALGGAARYLAGVAALRAFGPGFPWGTFAVNVIGSFLIGVLVVVLAARGGERLAPFLITGVLGGFTTFSAFSLDALTLWDRGQALAAGIYVAGSVLAALVAAMAGMALARAVTA
jgi:fluoride exporter